ncbi:hypothetical protein TNCV_3081621 [Trichonephila clavipes]|nr:hypothetical protein TNCV_3081621 [Trichonephila clavipes]
MAVVSISREVLVRQFQIYARCQGDIITLKNLFCCLLFGPFSCELQGVKNGSQQRENSVHFTVFFGKSENESQVAEIVNGVYGADTVTVNYVQFWFRRYRSCIFDVKVAPRQSSKMSIKSQK